MPETIGTAPKIGSTRRISSRQCTRAAHTALALFFSREHNMPYQGRDTAINSRPIPPNGCHTQKTRGPWTFIEAELHLIGSTQDPPSTPTRTAARRLRDTRQYTSMPPSSYKRVAGGAHNDKPPPGFRPSSAIA